MKTLADGEPGDCFRTEYDDQWAIWKILDGQDLITARELGYDEKRYPVVVACILLGDRLNLPYRPQFDENDYWLPYGMDAVDTPVLAKANWTYLGKL